MAEHKLNCTSDVTVLRGVGEERAAQLGRLGIRTVADLLLHRPRRYEDRRNFSTFSAAKPGEPILGNGTVVGKSFKRFPRMRRCAFEMLLADSTGHLRCRWWNLRYMTDLFAIGDRVVVYGKVTGGKTVGLDHPETEIVAGGEEDLVHLNRITPIYPLTEGLSQRWLRGLIFRVLQQGTLEPCADPALQQWDRLACARGFLSRKEALRAVHFPESIELSERARQRLALEELAALQTGFLTRRRNFEEKASALLCGGDNRFVRPFLARLGFKLTASQTEVLRELRADLRGPYPARRLLQGDVGSGKTVVSACAALMAMESGYDVALMAPTELLAQQHYTLFTRWFEPLDLGVALITGSCIEDQPVAGPKLYVGTHALLHMAFDPQRLGLVIIDEQHKFGVAQRETLVRKGHYPHLLVMTATPIPRTLALTLYGDLDVSILRQKPPGRGRLKTHLRDTAALPKVWDFVREKLATGRQAYVIYPLVEDAPRKKLKSVQREFANIQRALGPFKVGLLHGQMPAAEKEVVMNAFRRNEIQALVATSLIEVGVDVPNATVMLIENAEAFGLAQLHQLRGRVGRGAHESHCILVAEADPAVQQRLRVMVDSADGFGIAEHDLALRGPGEMLGREQSGMPEFRFVDLRRDLALVDVAREVAKTTLPRRF